MGRAHIWCFTSDNSEPVPYFVRNQQYGTLLSYSRASDACRERLFYDLMRESNPDMGLYERESAVKSIMLAFLGIDIHK